jgi:RNA polymerase sigma-70 factor (ECF subfamily)
VHNDPAQPSPDEFVTFMHAYEDMVFSVAARLTGNDAQAEDLAQEAFLKAYEHFGQLRGNPSAGGWLKTVTTRLALHHLGRYRRRWRFFSELRPADAEEGGDPPPELEIPTPDSSVTQLDNERQRALIERALAELPEQQRVPLVLYHFQDLSYEEIAAMLRISLAKLKTDIHRGRQALERQLARLGLTSQDL